MPYAAITYRVKTGHEEEIKQVFDRFRRVSSPVITDEHGTRVGLLLGTALFLQDDVMVRLLHYDGQLEDVARHMSRQEGMRAAERDLSPYLAQPRDTQTPEGFLRYFDRATMRCLQQFSLPPGAAA